MCLTIPQEILQIDGKYGIIALKQNRRVKIDLSLIGEEKVKRGDFVLVSKDIAIQKISKAEAKEILGMLNDAQLNKKEGGG